MALQKISDFDTDYRNTIQGHDIKGMDVYTQGSDDKIATVSDVLVDYDYDDQVPGVYRSSSLEASAPLDTSKTTVVGRTAETPIYNRDSYTYGQDADLSDTH